MSVTCLIKTIEEMVLGLGKHTGQWFESAPAPENDGEVLIVQIDSKATPAATEEELGKRRGKRAVNANPGSQRHRGKEARKRRGCSYNQYSGNLFLFNHQTTASSSLRMTCI